MKRLLYMVITALPFVGCADKPREMSATEEMEIRRRVDSQMDASRREITRSIYFDTVGVGTAPIRVISARLVGRGYSNYKSISLTFQNVGGKKIDAVRFSWYGENAFGEPADMGGVGERGFGGGYDDDPIGPGAKTTSTWDIMSRDGKKNIKAWPREVVFADGSKWASGSKR